MSKRVYCEHPDGSIEVFESGKVAAQKLGVSHQSVSISCYNGFLCQGNKLRYILETGEILNPTRRKRSPQYQCYEVVKPVVEILVGDHTPELMAYLESHLRKPYTLHKIKFMILSWYFTVGYRQGIRIPSDAWVTAWTKLKQKKRHNS